jgi:hypothetical protein
LATYRVGETNPFSGNTSPLELSNFEIVRRFANWAQSTIAPTVLVRCATLVDRGEEQAMTTAQMTDQEFEALINSITAHNKLQMEAMDAGHTIESYQLPEWAISDSGGDYKDLPQAAKEAFIVSKTKNLDQVDENKKVLPQVAQQRQKKEIPDDEYNKRIKDQIEENKKKYGDDQDKLGEKLILVGKGKSADIKALILEALAKAAKFLIEDIWDAVKKYVINLVKEFLKDIIAFLEKKWDDIKKWFHEHGIG